MDKHLGVHKSGATPRRFLDSRAASPFVGRDGELRQLSTALSLAAEGQGGTVFLTGQPGIGKTRLARECLAMARGHGFTVLEGRAHPLEAGLAYAPFLDAFGPLLRSFDSTRLRVLASDLPDLGRLFSDLRLPQPVPLGDPSLEKTRLFESVRRVLERLAQDSPMALFIDDVHWADPATLELLYHVARGLAGQRLLILASYSAGAMETIPGLRTLVLSLQRSGLASEINLPHLASDEVNKLVRGITGGEAPTHLLDLLISRAGGTPLFIEALVEAFIDSGNLLRSPSERDSWIFKDEGTTTLPPSVRHPILERLERLAPLERRVCNLVAIMGDAGPHAVLRNASGMEEEALLDVLTRLRATGLVDEGMDGLDVTYRITHPLIQEVAYAEMSEATRRRSHRAIIKALESFSEARPEELSRLARHYRGAGSEVGPERALEVLLAAADRAQAVQANDEAAQNYEAAIAIVRTSRHMASDVSSSSKDGPTFEGLPWLLERLGETWERLGKLDRTIQVWTEALNQRERTGDMVGAARLRGRLALAECDQGHFDVAKSHLRTGMAALAGHRPCQELADLLLARLRVLDRLENDVAGVANGATELRSVAEQLVSPWPAADANLAACVVSLGQDDVRAAHEHASRGLEIAEQQREIAICHRARSYLALIGMRLGDHRLMRLHAEQGLATARGSGASSWVAIFLTGLAQANFMSGAWDKSRRQSVEAIALARTVGHPRDLAYALAGQAVALTLQGELSSAAASVSEARTAFGCGVPADRYVFGRVDIAETSLALERGDAKRALRIAAGFICPPGSTTARGSLPAPYVPMGLMLLAEAQVAAGQPADALQTARSLIDLAPTGCQYLVALASRAEGLARQALGQREAAMACLAQAYAAFTAIEMPFEAARSSLERAIAADTMQPKDEPLLIEAAMESIAIFQRLGAQRYVNRARRLLRELGISPPNARRAHQSVDPLSERELEVARLVARGLTTAEIAKHLTLSPLTVSSHLHHMYVRLGIDSRRALAQYVLDRGLGRSAEQNT